MNEGGAPGAGSAPGEGSAPGVLLVTGCSSGFGPRIALRARAAGWTVYATVRDLGGERVAALVEAGVIPLRMDLCSAADRDAVVERILGEQGRLDALVNNAGAVLGGFFEDLEEDELRSIMEVNFFGTVALTRRCLPAIRASRGVILTMSSVSGLRAFPGLGAYAASKFALEAMTEALAQELEPLGVRVALIEPGAYSTDIWGRNKVLARHTHDEGSPYAAQVSKLESAFEVSGGPGAGDPEEIATVVMELLANPKPPLRNVHFGSRRTRLLFTRVYGRLQPVLPETP